jgi:O-antigen/teichoic acid export membrane protein
MVQDLMSSRAGAPRGGVVHYGWRRAIGPFWLTSVSNVFLANADVIIVGILLGSRAAGLYFAANRLALLLAFFMTSYNVVVAPMLAEVWQDRDATKAQEILRDATVKASIPTLVFGAALIIFAPAVLQVFGPDFVLAAPALRLLVLAGIFNALTGPADIALNMCGYERPAMRISAVTLILNAGILGLGASSGSITGVALAVLFGTVLRKGLFWFTAMRRMGIRTDILAFTRNMLLSVPARG